jgi:MFS family permease
MEEQRASSLSKMDTARALRLFLYIGVFWSVYSQVAGVVTPVFTGFALSILKVKESAIGTIASFAALAGLAQLFSLLLTRNIRRKSLFIIRVGFAEIITVLSIVFIPLILPKHLWLGGLIFLITVGTVFGHLVSPVFQSWFATAIPQQIRARYLSKRTIVIYTTAIIFAYGAGRFLDAVGGYKGFLWVFCLGMAAGIAGYVVLFKVPFPQMRSSPLRGFLPSLVGPFHNQDFRRLLIFYITWVFAVWIGAPFYTVFMLRRIELSYSTIAILNNIQMVCFILGLRFYGEFIDRYGNKPILQILLVPRVLLPIMWIFNSKENFILLPVVMALTGFVTSGLLVAISNFLYGIAPQEEEKTGFFAAWAASVGLASCAAPIIGGRLVEWFKPVQFNIGPFPVGNLQMVFLVSAMLLVVPVFLLRKVREEKASSPGYVLGQIRRGNPFSFAYNFFLFSRVKGEQKRARHASAMGKSKSPMAVEKLMKAMDDLSPQVRSEATKALGETKQVEAIPHLAAKLNDSESDIRPEAAQALGKIRSKEGISPLLKALDDPDIRVRNSAIMALADIGDEEGKEHLFRQFSAPFNRFTFPNLVEALSKLKDNRIIPRTIMNLEHYNSPVIRLQILNAVCRVLGAKNQFYELLTQEELKQVQRASKMLRDAQKQILANPKFPLQFRRQLASSIEKIRYNFENEHHDQFLEDVRELFSIIHSQVADVTRFSIDAALAMDYIRAVQEFLLLKKTEDIKPQGVIFLIFCLKGLVDILTDRRKIA